MDWMQNLNDYTADMYWYNHLAKSPGFETFTVPENFTVYHGGGALRANVEYPIGRLYYQPVVDAGDPRRITPEQRSILRNDSIPQDMIKNYIDGITRQYTEHAFFGSYSTAIEYSKTVPGCGINCVGVYKFRKTTPIVDMGDAGNVYKILFYPNNLDDTDKRFIAEVYGISSLKLEDRGKFWKLNYNTGNLEFIKPVRKSMRNSAMVAPNHPYFPEKPEYFIIPKLIELFKSFGFDGFANPRFESRMSEFVIFDPIKTLVRDVTNPLDWQAEANYDELSEIGKLIKSMKQYDTTNIDFHAGDLYAHSVWVALNVQKWLLDPGNKWTPLIKTEVGEKEIKMITSIMTISAFLHDIGKMGGLLLYYDKPTHPEIGYNYLSGKSDLILYDGSVLNVDTLFKQILPPNQVFTRPFIIGIVRLHWLFGEALKNVVSGNVSLSRGAEEYIREVLKWWVEVSGFPSPANDKYFHVFILCLMVISACDVLGSQVFIDDGPYEEFKDRVKTERVNLNAYVRDFPFIANSPKKHRGGDKYHAFKFDTVGFELYNEVYKKLK